MVSGAHSIQLHQGPIKFLLVPDDASNDEEDDHEQNCKQMGYFIPFFLRELGSIEIRVGLDDQ